MSSDDMGSAITPPLIDHRGRKIDYVRLSVTDMCNLRCRYCVPDAGLKRKPKDEILRYEEITRLARIFADLGVHRFRITGGEPLVRPKLTTLVALLRETIPDLQDLALTTNGQLLARNAEPLRKAGLDRVNVSLDSLSAERYRAITGGDIAPVLEGVERAMAVGLHPVKLNVVLVRGMNDDEAEAFAKITLDRDIAVRFIEYMPLGIAGNWAPHLVVREAELRERFRNAFSTLEPAENPRSSRGGKAFRIAGALGTVAFISPFSAPFCSSCNRLRLTAEGRLRLCLMWEHSLELRELLRGDVGDSEIAQRIRMILMDKPLGHTLGREEPCRPTTSMCAIGG